MGFFSGLASGAAGLIPGVGNMVNSFLHPEAGYKDAAKKMQAAWGQAQQFQQPYAQAGQNQLGTLTGAENSLLDPSALLAKWMDSYQMSPFAEKTMQNSRESGLDAASSMGLSGSSAALNNIQQSAGDVMNADRSQFLNDLMQKYMTGIGLGQNIFNTGAATAGNMGNQAIGVGENLGAAAYGAKNAPGNLLKDLISTGAKAYMAGAGGGM